jgi:paraquat-inducible protein B
MTHAVAERPSPVRIKKMHWPVVLIWMVPILAVVAAGFYLIDYLRDHGISITVALHDGSGLKPGQTNVSHLGVPIGQVESVELSPDQNKVLVHIRLVRSAEAFAEKGALFWTVRPQVTTESISGLDTIASGPYIEGVPGAGDRITEFAGLDQAPSALGPGLSIQLHAVRLEHLQPDSPVYYRGFQVGVVRSIQMRDDATGVTIQIFIQRRYANLVRAKSDFWIVSGFDVKGGILTGIQMKLDSLRSVLSGSIAFATPEKDFGDPAVENSEYPLFEDPKPDWLNWAPAIHLPPDDSAQEDKDHGIQSTQQSVPAMVNSTH